MDIRASKGITVGQSNEHQRRWSEKGWNNATATGNYDRSREPLNFEIKKGGIISSVDKRKSIPQLMAENLAERGIKDPNEGRETPKYRTVVNFIFGGTRERMHEIAFEMCIRDSDWSVITIILMENAFHPYFIFK